MPRVVDVRPARLGFSLYHCLGRLCLAEVVDGSSRAIRLTRMRTPDDGWRCREPRGGWAKSQGLLFKALKEGVLKY